MNTKLWLIVPCYNEEEVLPTTAGLLRKKMDALKEEGAVYQPKILLVDDGSSDKTWEIIRSLCTDDLFIGIRLSHNQGHQNALLAGMMYAKDKCDCIISLDADLQDDIDVLKDFIVEYENGCDVVYGIRNDRSTDSLFKRKTAELFYRFMKLMGTEVVDNHADYRLLSAKALRALSEYGEINLFLRGVVPLIGMKCGKVYYSRKVRAAGKTKYPLQKMVNFAVDGVTSFSVKPLRWISVLGILFSVFSLGGLAYALISYFSGHAVPGWTAIVCSIWLLGGIVLLCIGVLGEYIGKIYMEVKRRPRFFIDEILNREDSGEE